MEETSMEETSMEEITAENIIFINRKKNFTRVLFKRKQIQIENIICCAIFGNEIYNKKKILNLKLPADIFKKIINLERGLENLSDENNIRSSCRGEHIRVYITNKSRIVDHSHNCRIFADIRPKSNLLVTLSYQGFWVYENTCGHYWQATTITFINNSEQ